MFSESVAQNPTIAVRLGANTLRSCPSGIFDGCDSIGPNPPALAYAQPSSTRPITMRNGAAHVSRNLIDSVPFRMKWRLMAQKTAKPRSSPGWMPITPLNAAEVSGASTEGRSATRSCQSACPPSHVWMPNHPQATSARSTAGTFAPVTPNDARANTGNGMPYRVPAWAFRIIGSSTMTLPSATHASACRQLIP